MTHPISGVPTLARTGDLSDFARDDRTNEPMLLQPMSSSSQKDYVFDLKALASASCETTRHLGLGGPEGTLYGFTMKEHAVATSSSKISDDAKPNDDAGKAVKAHDDAKSNKIIPRNTPCVLKGVKDIRYKDRMCTVIDWDPRKHR